jgi:cell fate (sporulation/competence/biofilm development) regulator YlbF (YheA/YmcA/DUF963 family)
MMDERLQQAAERLGQALRASAPLTAHLDANAALEADAEATGLLDAIAQRQAELRVKQNDGGLTEADVDALRALQFRVQTQPSIAAYLETNQDLRALLSQVNQEISQLLAVDFAGLARKSGCC